MEQNLHFEKGGMMVFSQFFLVIDFWLKRPIPCVRGHCKVAPGGAHMEHKLLIQKGKIMVRFKMSAYN